MGQGGESRALAQDQYEEDQRMLNKSQQREKSGYKQPDDFIDEGDDFGPMAPSSSAYPARKATVLRVSSAQKKRPPAQGMQGYEDDETQRPTLKYDQVYGHDNTPGKPMDPFNNEYPSGVTPYRKS